MTYSYKIEVLIHRRPNLLDDNLEYLLYRGQHILDGIAQTVSLGYIAPGLCMRVCRHLMMARFEKKNEQK